MDAVSATLLGPQSGKEGRISHLKMMLWLCFTSVRVRTNAGGEGIRRRTLLKVIESKESCREKKKRGSWCQATISLFFLFVVALFGWLYSGHTRVFLHRNTHVYTVICNAASPCLSPTIYFGSGGCWNFCSCA